MFDIIKTHELGRPLAYHERVGVNKPIDEALMIAQRARIGWEDADFRIALSPICDQKNGPAI